MPQALLTLPHDVKGIFRTRPNRFLGIVDVLSDSKVITKNEKVHIHDPGRLKELLYSGNRVLLKRASNSNRKTGWDILAARAPDDSHWVFIHSGYHRTITENILNYHRLSPFGKIIKITPEVTVGHSRLDFLLTKPNHNQIYVEVKGCTLAVNGTALFPDAPTERGTRHLRTLIDLKISGVNSALIILIFRQEAETFAPNSITDPQFSDTFSSVVLEHKIPVYPISLNYDGEKISYIRPIPIAINTDE
jgi:sugar fermentation stimulation protein A